MTFDQGPGIPLELARQSESFVGREWALAEIESWYLSDEPSLIVTADPGVGKSALAVRLSQISRGEAPATKELGPGWLHAWHFCQAHRFTSLNIRGVLEQVAGQLCTTLPGYAETVARHAPATTITINQAFTGSVQNSTVIGINQLVLPDAEPDELLHRLLRQPLAALAAKVVVLFDAVDETEEQLGGPHTLARLLSTLRADPVPGLRLVLTTRNGYTAERFAQGKQLRLRDDEPTGSGDLLIYLRARLHDRRIANATHLAELIADAADSNFLFATLAASEDAERLRRIALGELTLPHGLVDLYSGFLRRQVTADPGRWREVIRPVLGLLVQSRGNGFTRTQLARISGLCESAVDDALELCAPYLRGSWPDGPFFPFHGSLRDHLRSASRHGVYARESTERIVAAFRADGTDPHGVEHLLGYLADRVRLVAPDTGGRPIAEHGRWVTGEPPGLQALHELEEAVTDCDHLSARVASTGVDRLLDEITTLHRLFPSNPVLGAIRGVLGRQAHNLRDTDCGPTSSFTTQQLLYECAVSGHSGLCRSQGHAREPVITTLWSTTSANARLLSHTLATSECAANAVAMSKDGTRTALSGFTFQGNDMHSIVQLFDTETGSMIRSLSADGNTNKVFSLRFSDNGRQLTALRVDRTGTVWDLSSGAGRALVLDEFIDLERANAAIRWRPPYALLEHVVPPGADELIVAVTPDQRYAAVTMHPRTSVTVWDLANHTELGRYEAELVRSLAISPDGRWVVVGSALGGTHVLSPLSPAPRISFNGHRGSVHMATLRGRHAATAGNDGSMKIWDVPTGRVLRTMDSPSGAADTAALALDDEADLCVAGTHSGSATLYDASLSLQMRPLMVCGTPCDENWRTRAGARKEALPPVGTGDCCPREHWPTRVNDRHGSPVSALDISPDGHRVVTGTLNGVVRVWDTATGDLVREVTRGGQLVRAARFTPEGDHLITVAQLGGLYRSWWVGVEEWSLATGDVTRVLWPDGTAPYFRLPDDAVVSALTRDGRYLATGDRSGAITVHDLAARERVSRLVLHGAITCLAFDGLRLLAGTANGDVTLADVRVNA
ncbi:beta transducin-like protein [Streptomyces albus]|uniref:Beta transducin-like protein n=1 Tax=Streptomyces albus (strain ATCC 21838 / DSM 41398 / FERM P-419 / JCM 4703 / NBRC 107858) TaxID=1081613 RepID=A0A0B5ELS3_STRA4|nr:beta transducin-like protein [Streptomyces albus]AOU77659.1 beta transducin-like protein [Streptomyces albus]AYN33424.1 hypothetical protein DUI70_2923 [Streptomyces albus]